MKTIHKRLVKLEERSRPGPETERDRVFRGLMEGVRRSLAADRVSRGLPPEDPDALKNLGLPMAQILRQRFSRPLPKADS